MARFNEQPKTIGDLLNTVAGRLRKVDIRAIDQIRELWPNIVDPVLAENCRPEFIKNGVPIPKRNIKHSFRHRTLGNRA